MQDLDGGNLATVQNVPATGPWFRSVTVAAFAGACLPPPLPHLLFVSAMCDRAGSARSEAVLPAGLAEGLSRPQIPTLTGLRAVAALTVVFYHAHPDHVLVSGGFGVLVFFVLSGFLITWLMLEEVRKTSDFSLRRFYARRALRIFPAFYAYWLLVTMVVILTRRPFASGHALSSFFYLSNYYQALFNPPSNGYSHTWSLAVEEQFYLIWPGVFLLLHRRPRRLLLVLATAIPGIWALRLASELKLGVDERYIYNAFEMRFDHLLIGCLLAILLHERLLARFWRWLCGSAVPLAACLLVLAGSVWVALRGGTRYRDTVGFIVDPVVIALLLPQLIARSSGPGVSWLEHPITKYIGVVSYSLYLYHPLFTHPTQKVLARFHLPLLVEMICVALVMIAAASASYYCIERPFLRWKEMFKKPAQKVPQDAPAVA